MDSMTSGVVLRFATDGQWIPMITRIVSRILRTQLQMASSSISETPGHKQWLGTTTVFLGSDPVDFVVVPIRG